MSEQLSEQTYFDQAIGFTFSYYDIPEVDRLVMKLENQIEQLKAETRTDNSAVIEKMATEIAELKQAQRWRAFSEEKPKKDQWCLVYHEGEIDVDHYTDHCNNHCRFVMYGNYVTHWMPLPKEPEAI